jgi:hypothetical protein
VGWTESLAGEAATIRGSSIDALIRGAHKAAPTVALKFNCHTSFAMEYHGALP